MNARLFWIIYTNGAAGSVKEQRLKTGFLRRTIKLLTDPAEPRVTRTHSPRTTLGEALIALWGSICQADRKLGNKVWDVFSAQAHSSCPYGNV